MENLTENRHDSTKQVEDERSRVSGGRGSPAMLSPHIQIDEQETSKITIRKAQREEYRRKKSKTNNEEMEREVTSGMMSENENMDESDDGEKEVAGVREIRDKIKAVIKCIEMAYSENQKKAPSLFDKAELYQFVETLERRIVFQLEKNLILAERNLSLAEQALFLSNTNNRQERQETENMNGAKKLYSEILMKENTVKIQDGRKLPVPTVPTLAKHFPSDCVIIIKADKPGRALTDNEVKRGKDRICRQMGNVLALEVLVIRTTRAGGYIIVLKSPAKREEIKEKLIHDELSKERIILPKAKLPKVICRDITDEFAVEELQRDLYSWKNQKLQTVPPQDRKAKIIHTRLGLVMELSSSEAMAIELQDWRIRFGYGNEIKMEEFIPIQQCYNCSCFGHSADYCENMPRCRLCAGADHSGRDCKKKNDRASWKCINCLDSNQRRNTKLNCNHGAAQLHKCQIAQNEREIKRQQMINEGIYVSNSAAGRAGLIQNNGNANNIVGENLRIPTSGKTIEQKFDAQNGKGKKSTYLSNEKINKNMQLKALKYKGIEHEDKNENKNITESESDLGNEGEEDMVVNIGRNGQPVRSIESQRKGFGQLIDSEEGNDVDESWSTQLRGRVKSTVRQRSASRIRRSGVVAKSQRHTRSTTNLGEALLVYSPIKRRDVTRRGRPTRSGDIPLEDEANSDNLIRRMTPRSEGHGVRRGRIGGYVDRREGGSRKESDEAMSTGGETAIGIKGKERNGR